MRDQYANAAARVEMHWACERLGRSGAVRYTGPRAALAPWDETAAPTADVVDVDGALPDLSKLPLGHTVALTVLDGAIAATELVDRTPTIAWSSIELVDGELRAFGRVAASPSTIAIERLAELTAQQLAHLRERHDAERSANADFERRALGVAWRVIHRRTARLRAALERVEQLREELSTVNNSKRHRAGVALMLATRSPREALRLPIRLARLRGSKSPAAPQVAPPHPRAQRLDEAVDRFLEMASASDAKEVVFVFSGTTFIQPLRANRPIRLTRVFLERGIPTYFSYHGQIDESPTPSFSHPCLVETPIDFTKTVLNRIARADLGDKKKLLIVGYPHATITHQLNLFNAEGWATIYDCRDDWEAFAEVGAASWYRPELEEYVVNNCDETVCVSKPLRDKMATLTTRRPVGISPNAYDPAFLAEGYRHEPGEEVVIGYFGHLSASWFDWPSLARIARMRPSFRFQIIGHMGPQQLSLPPNVELLGPKTHPQICEIAKKWRVAIIPFRVGVLADAVDPIKIYEYFALRLPVVSFRMPQIDDYPHTRTVSTAEDFAAALDRAIEEPVDESKLAAFLDANTWGHRVDQLLEISARVHDAPPIEKSFNPRGRS